MNEIQTLSGRMIGTQEAANLLGCTLRYLYRIQEWLPPHRIGRSLFYYVEDVERYAAEHPRLGRNNRVA